ncbi:PE-PPE domain-containing protein [Mycobacterium hubeiense]|uniref:PE-PPE domain-containing protein n=1 Tax=Mycobacterium hubeiense TaxID=1867256 RepID=UPI000C7F61FD|nr:PE-PPE domain-containing protein [Mycobacterium sp. QGD 101]
MTVQGFFRGWARRCLAGGAVVVISAALTVSVPDAGRTPLYNAAVRLAGTTLGVGGTIEGFALSIPFNFYGTIVPEGDRYRPVPYPGIAGVDIPIVSDLPVLSYLPYWPQSMTSSVDKGAFLLSRAIAAQPTDDKTTIIGMSQGSMVAETVRAEMAEDPEYVANADNYEFILLGNPYRPVGGIATRFNFFNDTPIERLLGVPIGRPGPADSPFKTTDYSNQYDPVSDFPAYFNPLSLANAAAGAVFQHAIPGYFLDDPNNPNRVETTVGNTTYVLLPQHLPLLYPFHVAASVVGMERFVDFAEPALRVLVEMGYDRTADPSQVSEFSLITPPEKIAEAVQQLPGAVAEGVEILGGKKYVPPAPPAPVVESPASEEPEAAELSSAAVARATENGSETPATTRDTRSKRGSLGANRLASRLANAISEALPGRATPRSDQTESEGETREARAGHPDSTSDKDSSNESKPAA